MNNHEKTLALLLALIIILSMTACFGPAQPLIDNESDTTPVETEPATPTVNQIIKSAVLQYPASNEQFKYNVYDTYVEITEYIGGDVAELIVPATLEEPPVYVITYKFFDNKPTIDTVIFEDGIYTISAYFNSATVRKVVLPSTLYGIHTDFKNCFSLEEVIIPEGIETLGSSTFEHCSNIKEVTLPPTMSRIDSNMFAYCLNLEKVTIPEGITTIGENAFLACNNLASITIPSTVGYIGANAFQGTELVEIEIPETVTKVGSGLFTTCEALKKLTVYNAEMVIEPKDGFNFALLFSQCSLDFVVHGKPTSTIANQCARENVFFEVMK